MGFGQKDPQIVLHLMPLSGSFYSDNTRSEKDIKNSAEQAVADIDKQGFRKVSNSTLRMAHVFEAVGDIFSIFCPHTVSMSLRKIKKNVVYSIELPFIWHTLNYYRKLILSRSTRENVSQ